MLASLSLPTINKALPSANVHCPSRPQPDDRQPKSPSCTELRSGSSANAGCVVSQSGPMQLNCPANGSELRNNRFRNCSSMPGWSRASAMYGTWRAHADSGLTSEICAQLDATRTRLWKTSADARSGVRPKAGQSAGQGHLGFTPSMPCRDNTRRYARHIRQPCTNQSPSECARPVRKTYPGTMLTSFGSRTIVFATSRPANARCTPASASTRSTASASVISALTLNFARTLPCT